MKEPVILSLEKIDLESETLCKLSDAVWENPETAFAEYRSAGPDLQSAH